MSAEADPEAMKSLQESIYRDKVLRARAMTPAERLAEAFECTTMSLHIMFAGAMSQLQLTQERDGWNEVARRIDLGRRLHDQGRFQMVAQLGS
jgi:hypothetical protein